MSDPELHSSLTGWRGRLHEIIYEADTPLGRFFDIALIWLIVLSVVAVMIESVDTLNPTVKNALRIVEWVFTLLFTVEYVIRLLCVERPMRYATSFFGIVDLLAILPTYLSILFPQTRFLLVIRILRLLRVFRILKLARYVREASVLVRALRASRVKILVFVYTVLTIVVVVGALMYVVEGERGGFTSIPRSVYWAIVTLTTVGYGDIAPTTVLGQILASVVMILGYGIIAVPTGIVTMEMVNVARADLVNSQACQSCGRTGHDTDADFCKFCGGSL